VRIGVWNLEGKWSPDHLALLERERCDVWLLTEVHVDTVIPGLNGHCTTASMAPRKRWAGVFSTLRVLAEPDPHLATAMAWIEGIRFTSSVLPWRACGPSWPGATHPEKLRVTLGALEKYIDDASVWGGDWNQALEGPEYVGSLDGRRQILQLTQEAGHSVPTATLGSARKRHRSIDHISVPMDWDVDAACRVVAEAAGRRLSDHDAYIVSVER
jgi:endonuclease/exonuclease/phosphatase family metal-dependent hydrolase